MTALAIGEPQDWETRERARLNAKRCRNPKCRALPPNHLTDCELAPLPDPDAERCEGCEYPAGSLGCRMAHKSDPAVRLAQLEAELAARGVVVPERGGSRS